MNIIAHQKKEAKKSSKKENSKIRKALTNKKEKRLQKIKMTDFSENFSRERMIERHLGKLTATSTQTNKVGALLTY